MLSQKVVEANITVGVVCNKYGKIEYVSFDVVRNSRNYCGLMLLEYGAHDLA